MPEGPAADAAAGGGTTNEHPAPQGPVDAHAGSTSAVDPRRYPPARTGDRGSHPGSFAVSHAIRDGATFDLDGVEPDEMVDLVVVGAGISGLAAAWFWRVVEPNASILLLDNHDDFGGHARRVEFEVDGRRLISYGGSETLQSPSLRYGEVALGLLEALGVDLARFHTAFDRELYPSLGLARAIFFTREAFGVDRLVVGDPMRMVSDDVPPDRMHARPIEAFVGDFPVSDTSRAGLIELFTSTRDPLAGRSEHEKREILETTSYRDFLRRWWELPDEAADTFHGRPLDFFAATIDGISALDAMETGYPGFAGLGLEMDPDTQAELEDPYIHHFPDGNASIARLLVRELVPGVAPGSTMEDVVTAPFDYRRLDDPRSRTRIRLESTAVHVANVDGGVDVGYGRLGELRRVRARRAILAGYHMMIPSLMPELPPRQRRALWRNVKRPLVYTKVAVRHWRPWARLGVHEITNPMGFFSRVKLDYPVSLGEHRFAATPDEPVVLHLVHVPAGTAEVAAEAHVRARLDREALYARPLDEFEANVRDELTRMLGPGGFDADTDIAAITVNRWGHGYSYEGEPFAPEPMGRPMPFAIARAQAGNVAIANADAAWSSYAHVAIEQAYRAVVELTNDG